VTEQLKAALDALNACSDIEAAIDLLQRHKIRGERYSCRSCPVAVYLTSIGGAQRAEVFGGEAWIDAEAVVLARPVRDLAREFDRGLIPELDA
jgi:hypothetical protein